MDDIYPRPPLGSTSAARAAGSASASELTLDLFYVCSVCASPWPYHAVRNTGRCPTCGSGLQRPAEVVTCHGPSERTADV